MPANKTHISTESFPVASQHSPRRLHLSTSALVNNLPNQSPVFPTNGQAIQNNFENSGLPLCGTRTSPLDTVVVAASHMNMNHPLQVSQTTGTPFPPPTSFAAGPPQEPCKGREQASLDRSIFHPRIPYSAAAGSSDPSPRSGKFSQRCVTSSIDTLVDAPSTTPDLTSSEANAHNYNLNEKLSATPQVIAPPDCLRDLCNIKELCAMSMEQLEQLVGQVIREPEFPTLVRLIYSKLSRGA